MADTIDFKVLERLPTKNPDSLRELLHEVEQAVDRRLCEPAADDARRAALLTPDWRCCKDFGEGMLWVGACSDALMLLPWVAHVAAGHCCSRQRDTAQHFGQGGTEAAP